MTKFHFWLNLLTCWLVVDKTADKDVDKTADKTANKVFNKTAKKVVNSDFTSYLGSPTLAKDHAVVKRATVPPPLLHQPLTLVYRIIYTLRGLG